MFSSRVPGDLAPNRLTEALAAFRAEGRSIIDLTESNPTHAAFDYPSDILAPLADPRGLRYAPAPLGISEARIAVAREYARRRVAVAPEQIVLTASTSEAYALLFKVLADGGDEVLVPRPSYPLFEHLTRLEFVVPRPYDLEYQGGWSIDFVSVERAVSARTRAILAVSPNNPTGSFVKPSELERLAEICARSGIALIVDEVFADYELTRGAAAAAGRALESDNVLTFSLGGLSKSVGLPQVKLAWIAVGGPRELVRAAMERLDVACDMYLSVSTPVQLAAGRLLEQGGAVRTQIARRVGANYQWLHDHVASVPACRLLIAEGGWYAVLQVPSLQSEEDLVLDVLQTDGVLTHPGYFFDFPRESYLIVGLLPPEEQFREGIGRVLRHFECSIKATP
jgi:hypothetical protein